MYCFTFLYICNLSLTSGSFPDKMKVAKVVPLFKFGEKNVFTSMKVIKRVFNCIVSPFLYICNLSLTSGSFPDKMKVAKVVPFFNNKLVSFIEKYNILSGNQYGFRTKHSTSLALIELLENLSTSIDRKNKTVLVDLKKAFDTIDHSLLIRKLEFYGIRGKALSWVKSYLDNRKQYVHFDGVNSSLLKILCGVPQGSILGPNLFILYINDICNVSKIF